KPRHRQLADRPQKAARTSYVDSTRHRATEQRQPYSKGRPAAFSRLERDPALVQFDAPLDDEQTQAAPGRLSDVGGALKRFEEPAPIGARNPDAAITHGEHRIGAVARHTEQHGTSAGRILNRI